MQTLMEALGQTEDIINYHMTALHRLADIANTTAKDDLKAQEDITKCIIYLWQYLKPVHPWIRQLNPDQCKFYDELDKYIVEHSNHSSEVKSEATKENRETRRAKK